MKDIDLRDIEKDQYTLYLAPSGQTAGQFMRGSLYQVYCALDDRFMQAGSGSWIMFSIEHVTTGETWLCARMTPEQWKVPGDTYWTFTQYLEHFGADDFENRVETLLAEAAACGCSDSS